METENINVWFSYASAQQTLVSDVCQLLQSCDVEKEVVQKVTKPFTRPQDQAVKHGRIAPKCYNPIGANLLEFTHETRR